MSLYYEAASFVNGANSGDGSVRSRVYATKSLKSNAGHVYALLSEATRWSSVLSPIIEKAGVLLTEKKLTPVLALLLTHDLLLAKRGIAAPKDHVLVLAINRHKARLSAEFTRERIRSGHSTLDAWKRGLEDVLAPEPDGGQQDTRFHPRWVRINRLKSSLEQELAPDGVFCSWNRVASLDDLRHANRSTRVYLVDEHIPDLIATLPNTDLTNTQAYKQGRIILQDKASCFPAYLLNVAATSGDIIDGCAAPGNKTTHLAALTKEAKTSNEANLGGEQTIYAVERDAFRSETLAKMVAVAGCEEQGLVKCLGRQDFSKLKPEHYPRVEAILLDPSCSGSGIVGRDIGSEAIAGKLQLPSAETRPGSKAVGHARRKKIKARTKEDAQPREEDQRTEESEEPGMDAGVKERLQGLSGFQYSLLLHAFAFPAARRVVYSTCSVHAEENEEVVVRALASPVARARGWTVLQRADQVPGMRAWHLRGDEEAIQRQLQSLSVIDAATVAEACIRCHKAGADGTMGFFAAGFVRRQGGDEDEDEFCGFSDDEDGR